MSDNSAVSGQEQESGDLAASLQSMLQTVLAKVLNSQVVGTNGKPVGSMCYMLLEQGLPLNNNM